jgi:hypothetical protein
MVVALDFMATFLLRRVLFSEDAMTLYGPWHEQDLTVDHPF